MKGRLVHSGTILGGGVAEPVVTPVQQSSTTESFGMMVRTMMDTVSWKQG